ncbi:glycosyltransferase family 8 protein [Dolichospermum sp. FACHB-1091]|uniref:glycosyltransferase family 8 protein n=1 Tax=Dolichospermum sp. FACHB-1091 TaxID=2692798 RepID=UPI0016808241|nr:glycosyltransferase family 8 protein [Dolichospermum sp. FACHB-1091]MBD2444362.1 glycosyltransferase family 8 protein [Dolichospermum sp. FACHB-1091]
MFVDTNSLSSENDSNSPQVNDPIILVCAADDKYAMPLATMTRSVLENLQRDRRISFYIIDGGITKKNKEKILKTLNNTGCEVYFLSNHSSYFDESFKESVRYTITEGQAKKHLTIEAYYRLLIPELLPQKFEKAIYLDCDLVVNGDINQLWEIDLGDKYLLAAPDIWIHSVSAHNGLLNYQQLGIKDKHTKYFNTGVLVINVKKWRDEEFLKNATEYLKQNKEYIRFADQDILNGLLIEKWGQLDPQWNVTPGIYEYSSWEVSPFLENVYNSLINKPYITHFASAAKPWNSRNAIFKEYFYHYIDKTEWKGWRFTFWKELQLNLAYKFQKLKTVIYKSIISK